jgi:hypothetical protein
MGKKESAIEGYLCEQVTLHHGFTRKIYYMGRSGSPDRWCFFRSGRVLLVECKRPGEEPEPLQFQEMKLLRSLGQWVAWTDTREGVDAILVSFLTDTLRKFNEKFPLA